MKKGGATDAGKVRTVPAWIKVLVALHVVCTIVWALPNPPADVLEGRAQPKFSQWLLFWNSKHLKNFDPLRAYILATGSWQYWDMFAPEPAGVDFYCTAIIEYRDGTKREVAYPRIYSLSIPMKYVKERYRKFYERARDNDKPLVILWPAFAQTMALHNYNAPQNPPVVVRLIQHSREVAPPGGKQATEYQSHEYYAYAVDQAWLRKAAGR